MGAVSHGHATGGHMSPTYTSWRCMKRRCDATTDPWYWAYGGRGIAYDVRWASFENFLADMGVRPEGKTLERKKNNGPYCKDNCKWGTYREQTLNRTFTRWVTLDGRTMCLSDWCRERGLSTALVSWRLRTGQGMEQALSPKIRGYRFRPTKEGHDMKKYLYHKTSGRMYEVLGIDAATGVATLKNEMATFQDTLDAEKLAQRGYIRTSGADEAEARAKAVAKIEAEQEAA